MADHVGTLLWEMRTTTTWTLGKLAERAGISKAALSRWEAGLRQPRVTELEAVLSALGASSAQRSLALARISAPRALRQLRQAVSSTDLGAPLSAGDLLRAMRLRGGWTQEQVATRLGVTRPTLARWELGERLPATEQMQSLCYALEAREEEIIALTCGRFREVPSSQEAADWEEKETEFHQRLDDVNAHRVGGLEELHYVLLDRDAWHWALREPAARLFLGRLRTYHAHHHRLSERWELSRTLAQRAQLSLQGAPEPDQDTDNPRPDQDTDNMVLLRLAIVRAVSAVHSGVRSAPERGIRLLSPWVERSQAVPAFQAWILSDIAKYHSMAGNHDEAVTLAERACRVVEERTHPNELFLRRTDHGQLLLRAGRAEEALQALPDPLSFGTGKEAVDAILLQVEALGRVGRLSEARDWLERANVLIVEQALEPQRRKAQTLAERF
jgi:transcriptional regulator with XRE-family HTH domain